jgi:hypothetical protein
MDIRSDLYTFRPVKREEALKRRVSLFLFCKLFLVRITKAKGLNELPFFQLEFLQQALTNRVRTKSSQTHQRFYFYLYIYLYPCQTIVVATLLLYVAMNLSNQKLIDGFFSSSSLCAFFEVFSDYDPFLGHCAPSNPWITSDTDRWELLQPL